MNVTDRSSCLFPTLCIFLRMKRKQTPGLPLYLYKGLEQGEGGGCAMFFMIPHALAETQLSLEVLLLFYVCTFSWILKLNFPL